MLTLLEGLSGVFSAIKVEWIVAIALFYAMLKLASKPLRWIAAGLAVGLLTGVLSGGDVMTILRAGSQLGIEVVRSMAGALARTG